MNTMLTLNLTASIIFIMMNHPLSMGMILLMQTLLVSMITGNLNLNFWYSYILFLIMIGGMLILFMYMTSIASNEKFKTNTKIIIITIATTLLTMTITKKIPTEISLMNNNSNPINKTELMNLSMNKMINYPMNMILTMMMIYLLITLIATVKISQNKKGPLRQMSN